MKQTVHQILDIYQYPNLLDSIQLSSVEIMRQVYGFKLWFDSYKNPKVEWGMELPMFVDSFYDYIIANQKIPSQIELWNKYSTLPQIFDQNKDNNVRRGIKARLFRTYPSLVRDIHFNTLLRDRSKAAKVIYNKDLDIKLGIDLLVVFKATYYAINLFTNTRRAYIGRDKKKLRHKIVDNAVMIDVPVVFDNSHKWGDFFLYGE